MKIAVASGKGGTGKTFVSTNLFWVAQEEYKAVDLFDFDAEAPNVNEFLKGVTFDVIPVEQKIPIIDKNHCQFCGKCFEYCNYNAILYLKEKKTIQLSEELCHSCGACVVACEYGAITEKNKIIGKITVSNFKEGVRLIECRTEVGTPSSVPIIRKAKKMMSEEHLVLIDAPPGISCPFVATVQYVDYVVLVTEPTPFGLNDLRLSMDTLNEMKIPYGVVVNKSTLGQTNLSSVLQKEGVSVLLEIPFDKEIAKIYSEGEILVEKNEIYRDKFYQLLNNIKEILE